MPMIEPPLALLAELTHRCPLGCPYCSNPLELTKRSGELSTAQWNHLFDQAAQMGVLQLHFSGGEPAARKDLEVMNKHAVDAGLYTNLITSGVLITRERLKQLADDGLAHVQLSMQGADEAMTDLVGGYKGAYAQKAQVAEWVHEAGLALTLNCVLHRMNCHQAADMVQLAQDWGAQRVEMAHTQYYGWGLKNRAALLPTRAQLDEVTAIVQQARETLAGKLAIDYVVPDYYAMRPKACMNGWARRFINVMPDGTALPCHAAQTIEHLEFDNVTAKPLAQIWEKGDAFEAYRGTDWMKEPCKSCDRAEIDFGGCRCQALALTGDAANTDPACALSAHHQVMLDAIEDAPTDTFTYRRLSGNQ